MTDSHAAEAEESSRPRNTFTPIEVTRHRDGTHIRVIHRPPMTSPADWLFLLACTLGGCWFLYCAFDDIRRSGLYRFDRELFSIVGAVMCLFLPSLALLRGVQGGAPPKVEEMVITPDAVWCGDWSLPRGEVDLVRADETDETGMRGRVAVRAGTRCEYVGVGLERTELNDLARAISAALKHEA